ncbi:divinyl chlorophyllide a 8-vinyl-reductase [Aureococcus anophagefferens]|nr:divinyl chlorophyllide a 8-vinyl-reductase [Aureococcus anophagefferens]
MNVLITGATGRLGELLYAQAKADPAIGAVKAFVTNVTKAKQYLNCTKCDASEGIFKAVEFAGVENTVAALYAAPGPTPPVARQVVLCSSMGTTQPDPSPQEGGSILFWKLNAEAHVLAADLKGVVVKPCGLSMGAGGEKALVAGRDDAC